MPCLVATAFAGFSIVAKERRIKIGIRPRINCERGFETTDLHDVFPIYDEVNGIAVLD
jgi:hypothetical protein